MTNVVVHVGHAVIRMSPFGFWRYGSQYAEARKVVRCDHKKFSPVPYYLSCRALELLLKAYLLAQGWEVRDVKRDLHHNLERALKQAEEAGLGQVLRITAARREHVRLANGYYNSKSFEYIDIVKMVHAYRDLPNIRVLDRFNAALVKKLKPICLAAA